MIYLILTAVYLLSIVLCWWAYRLHSSKYWDIWLDDDCTFSGVWIIPMLNTLAGFMIIILGAIYQLTKNVKSKWLNTDL